MEPITVSSARVLLGLMDLALEMPLLIANITLLLDV
jgi:hypothetical protein